VRHSLRHTLLFATALCVVCSLLVSGVTVALRDRQRANQEMLGQGRHLLAVAGLVKGGESLARDEIVGRVAANLEPLLIDLHSGEVVPGADPLTYDQRAASADPERSIAAPENSAQVKRVPKLGRIFLRKRDGAVDALILPIEGMGIYSTMFGYIALEADARTIRGITFYEHGETPGLGAEIDNPDWKARWRGRLAVDAGGTPRIAVAHGAAGPPDQDPFRVDGISGATITGDGVTNAVRFWLGDNGFGPYLKRYRAARGG
jgi:Na+-transporting NADH:ubiquinone oxidoreductase subunit C